MKKSCKKCGNKFECAEDSSCWCFNESRIQSDQIKYDDCVCKNCLREQYKKKIVGS